MTGIKQRIKKLEDWRNAHSVPPSIRVLWGDEPEYLALSEEERAKVICLDWPQDILEGWKDRPAVRVGSVEEWQAWKATRERRLAEVAEWDGDSDLDTNQEKGAE